MTGRVLITGATGFLGGAVARSLREAGWEVSTTGRNPKIGGILREEGFSFEPVELAHEVEKIQSMTSRCDAVVHCAALSAPWGARSAFQAANIAATRNVVGACAAEGTRLIHVSTPSVCVDFSDTQPQREDAPWSMPPLNDYIATKREAENIVMQAESVRSIILRPKAMIGPGDTSLLPRVMRAARRGIFPVFTGVESMLDLTWIDDATEAVRLALNAPDSCHGKVYHITSGQPIPASEAFTLLFEACELRVKRVPVSPGMAMLISGVCEWISRLITGGRWEPPLTRYSVGALAFGQTLDITAARRDLGYLPGKEMREALRECGQSWRNQHHGKS